MLQRISGVSRRSFCSNKYWKSGSQPFWPHISYIHASMHVLVKYLLSMLFKIVAGFFVTVNCHNNYGILVFRSVALPGMLSVETARESLL
jgi:hypothetical protein